jgi:hypothetical protein
MATTIYESGTIELIDGTKLFITPAKIFYLRRFLDEFEKVKTAEDDAESMGYLIDCGAILMEQYMPSLAVSEILEDNIDMTNVYKLLELSAGIKINRDVEEEIKEQAKEEGKTWDDLDLAKLEADVFLLGIWKDYEELEKSLSMPELIATLNSKQDADYEEKKFFAAIQGIDLDEQSGKKQDDPWEKLKAKVFSGGATDDSNDILALQGQNAAKVGFGLGMGLDYEKEE